MVAWLGTGAGPSPSGTGPTSVQGRETQKIRASLIEKVTRLLLLPIFGANTESIQSVPTPHSPPSHQTIVSHPQSPSSQFNVTHTHFWEAGGREAKDYDDATLKGVNLALPGLGTVASPTHPQLTTGGGGSDVLQ